MEILQGCKNWQSANFTGSEFSQPAKFCNTAPAALAAPIDCFLTHLFVVLYKFALM